MKNNKTIIQTIIITLIVLLAVLLFWSFNFFSHNNSLFSGSQPIVTIAGQEIKVKIAQTPNQKELGLGKIKSLPENQGMLFIYDDYVIPNYWMKDMKFSIDIIWIKDNMVMGYEKDLKSQADNINLPVYQPKTFINYVLEVNSGFVDKYGLQIGDNVKLNI